MFRQQFEYHPVFGTRFIPGLKARIDHAAGGYLVAVNQSGFRSNREFVPEKGPGTLRVLLFGDSHTAAHGISNGHRYSDLLEQEIPGLEVCNFALDGTGIDQHYLVFQEMAPQIEHDLVVIGLTVHNIRRVVARYQWWATSEGRRVLVAKPYFTLEADGRLKVHHVPVPRDHIEADSLGSEGWEHVDQGARFARLRGLVSRMGPRVTGLARRLTRYQPVPAYDRPDNPDWLLLKHILLHWISEASVPVVIFPIPTYQHIEKTASPKGYRARFAELHDPPHVTVQDPLPDFHHFPRRELARFSFAWDQHPTREAHRIFADSLVPCVRRLMSGPLRRVAAPDTPPAESSPGAAATRGGYRPGS